MRAFIRPVLLVVLFAGAVATTILVAYLVPTRPETAMALAAVTLLVVFALIHPLLLPIAAVPVSVVVTRAGAGGVDMSVSDFALGLAFWPALLFGARPLSPPVRKLLWLNAVYQAFTLFTLIANPFLANSVEWIHAWLLVSGAIIIGWAVGSGGYSRVGLTLFMGMCTVLALLTLGQAGMQYARGDFSEIYPRWPWPMHKNAIGCILGFAALISYARPRFLGWGRLLSGAAFAVFLSGIIVAQSRQAIVGLVIGIVLYSFRSGERRTRTLPLLVGAASLGLIGSLVREQLTSDNLHNSAFQRLDWFSATYQVWESSPFFGQGLRYWYVIDDPALRFQPPNGILEVMATTGVVGLLGYLIFITGTVMVLWKLRSPLGALTLGLIVSRVVQGQLDLFWVSVQTSVPFLLAGLLLGRQALEEPAREGQRKLYERT